MTAGPASAATPAALPRGSLGAALRLAGQASAGSLIASVTLSVAAGLLPAAIAWLTKLLLDGLIDGRSSLPVVLALAGAGVVSAVLPQVNRYAEAQLQRSAGVITRQRLFAAVGAQQGLARLEDPAFHDQISLAAESGPSGPSEVVGGSIGVGQGLITAGAFLASLAALNPWMLLAVGVAAIPTLRAQLQLSRQRARMVTALGQAGRREFFFQQLITSPTAAAEIRLYGLNDLFGARLLRELRHINREHRAMDRRDLVVQGGLALLGAAVAGAGLVWAAGAVRAGDLTIGDIAVFIAAVAGVQAGLSQAIGSAATTHEALLLFGHYQAVVGAEPDLPVSGAARPLPELRHSIEFQDVWFRYADDLPWVLRGVNLTIPAGTATALAGHNGAGKSTIVKLLCRLYDPTRGVIRWDGIDLRDLPVEALRDRIRAVFQDFMHYELTAAENIGVGDVGRIDERGQIERAAEQAGADGTLSALPASYDTMLTRIFPHPSERDDPAAGVLLSGGQWQRVALARALFRERSDLLILDEPSTGLDAQAEHEVHQKLRALRAGRTSLLISHRLNTVRDAELIVVLDGGTVAERGTHDELIALGGLYAQLFRTQAAGYQLEPVDQLATEP